MAKPRLYTERRIARFDKLTDKWIIKKAKIMGLAPAVVIRVIVERAHKEEK